jgi:hypothetical protein
MLEQSTRSAAIYHQYLQEHRPDVVVLTPLVVLKTAQLDLARAAMELGIRNIFAVASWDHLSSKGELNFSPQQVMVWNHVQKQEATELHGLDPASIVVTGSQVFDDWFDRRPSTTREAFCERIGLKPDKPIVLYVCSSLLEGSPPERKFVVEWVKKLRPSGHPALRDCGIRVRPHHEHGEGWRRVSFDEFDNVAFSSAPSNQWAPGSCSLDSTRRGGLSNSTPKNSARRTAGRGARLRARASSAGVSRYAGPKKRK